jgi:hypothetical protein
MNIGGDNLCGIVQPRSKDIHGVLWTIQRGFEQLASVRIASRYVLRL